VLAGNSYRARTEHYKNYWHIWNHAEQSNYSGKVTITRYKPIFIDKGFDDSEGRIITTEFEKIFVVNVDVGRLEIPSNLTEKELPDDEIFELESFFEYIVKKYGL